jgi:hypothetical protein
MSRAKQAQERGGISGLIGEGLAYGAAVTSHKPARERANQEAKGNVVPESPGSLLLLPGTAVGRRAVAAVSTAFPKVQIIGDAWTIASNLVVARRRQKATIANNVLPDAKREEGRARYSDMTKLQGAATVASAALAIGFRSSKPLPPRPINTPGLETCKITLSLFTALSISIFETPAGRNFFIKTVLILMSSIKFC